MTDFQKQALLVLQAQSGDREALESVLRNGQADLLRYVSGLVGLQSAEDVLQDVLLQICRNLRWLRTPEVFRAWSYRIASRASFAFLKKERRWSSSSAELTPVDEMPAPPDPEMTRLFSELPRFIDHTSPASRAVLLLHYMQELSIEDVAAILDINTGTVKSRLAYGLASLRKSLESTGNIQ